MKNFDIKNLIKVFSLGFSLFFINSIIYAGNIVTSDGQKPAVTIDSNNNLVLKDTSTVLSWGESLSDSIFLGSKNFKSKFDGVEQQFNSFEEIIVNSLDDLNIIDNKIILENSKNYLINTTPFYTPYPIFFENGANVRLTTHNPDQQLIYIGDSSFALFNSTKGANCDIFSIYHMTCVSATGEIFDWDNSTPTVSLSQNIILSNDLAFAQSPGLGTIKGANVVFNTNFIVGISTGLNYIGTSLDNTFALINVKSFNWNSSTQTMFNASGLIGEFQFSSVSAVPNAGQSVLYLDPDLPYRNVLGVGINFNDTYGGTFFAPNSLDYSDPGVIFKANNRIKESKAIIDCYYTNLSSVTIVPSINVSTPLITTWKFEENPQRFIGVSTGTVIYSGLNDVDIDLLAAIQLDPDSGAATTWTLYFYKNGIKLSNYPSTRTIAGGAIETMIVRAPVVASTGDYFELWIEKNAGTGNISTSQGQGSISER